MKLLYRLIVLAVFAGCSSKQQSPEPSKPPEIHWRGPATGYEGDVSKPADLKP